MHSPLRLLRRILPLVLLGPTLALAQGTPALPEAPPSLTPPPIISAPEAPEEEPRNEPPPASRFEPPGGLRIAATSLTGALVAVGGGIGGFFIAEQVAPCGELCGTNLLGFGLGLTLAAPLGVYGMGTLLDEQGRFLPTFLGGLLGGVSGAFLLLVGSQFVPGATYLSLTMPVVGAVLGYELFRAPGAPSPEGTAWAPAGVQLQPVLGVTRSGGGVLGLAGRF